MKTNSNLEFRKIKSLDYLYEINENGTILRNVKSKKQIKIKLDTHHSEQGYYAAFVRHKGKPKRVMIHRAVAECWLGDVPENYEVDHIDRNSHNNNYSNLRYVTRSEQMKNRDHTRIAERGSQNLQEAREIRANPVTLIDERNGQSYEFDSYAETARFLESQYDTTFERMRSKLKDNRKHIYDYDVFYHPIKFF